MCVEFVEQIIVALADEQAYLEARPDKDGLLERLAVQWQNLMIAAAEENCLGLVDLFGFYIELQEQLLADQDALGEAETVFLLAGISQLDDFFQIPTPEAMLAVLDFLQAPQWPSPLSDEDRGYFQELLEADRLRLLGVDDNAQDEEDSALSEEVPAVANSAEDGGFAYLDYVLLAEGPISVDPQLIAMIGGQCVLLQECWQSSATLPERLSLVLEAVEPIVRATAGIRLWAGHFVLTGLMKNLHGYQDDPDLLGDDTPMLINNALAAITHYCQDTQNLSVQQALDELFANPEWPYCLSSDDSHFLRQLFAQLKLQTAAVLVAEVVSADDISLIIPDDVDPQLLDMAFNDLPQLTEDFAKHLQAFLNRQDREALRTAQRVAHTLKGLANMLGVKGIANLTHRLEDILEFLHTQAQSPDAGLVEALMEAADMLAVLGEALLARRAPPPQALSVLQQLADGHYRLQTGEAATPVAANPSPAAEPLPDEQEAAGREDTFVRVPKALLDQLFRVAGEVKISDTQLDEQLKQIKALLKTGGERYRTLQRVLADLEQLLATTLNNPSVTAVHDGFDPLEMNRLNEMHSSISKLYEAAADSREIERTVEGYARKMSDTLLNLAHLHKDSLENVLATRLLAVESMVPRLQRTLRQACRVAGKQAELVVTGGQTLIDSQILNQLADPLMHILRNAVDHGLEPPAQRLAVGKPEHGLIQLSFVEETDRIAVVCEDDGRGINRAAIRQIAEAKGLIDSTASLSEQDIDRLILIPGFSTRSEVSQLSGRGIGMDVVYQEVIRLKGKLEIASTPGQGCRFTLSIPASALLLKAQVARCGPYALSLIQYGIEKVLLSSDGQLQADGNGFWFSYQDQRYPAYSMENLIGLPSADYGQLPDFHLLRVNLGQGEKVVVMVTELLDSRELVFKDLGSYVPHNPAMPGVTVLADGQISPVIDLPEALKHKSAYNQRVMDYVAHTVAVKLPRVLVVDDSLSARKSLALLLKDSGYDVATAIDGLDALAQIGQHAPDLVITDMEMPRMDGVALTRALKQQAETAPLPVLMITSRSTDKHRQEAKNAGVDAYLTKPWTETQLLQALEGLL
ncbi:hybrid sensor histidine kinase/response regulator [Methylovulum psychrotolerans]|uniref:Chemotaxis protein CheA n=1 Tax=Methylovulum psychrotolerans TaxID=1704499 RepID=A0A2S5CLT1_9GAMM|nr:response regulator [Methylovulum psychrotolerans]POZ51773.1 hybrid sensor histidine kinase/response regulator [Methylovulum psychrotolerans]